MVKKTKRKSHYNSKDLFEEFKSLYSKQHKKEYEPKNFIGNEMKSLKNSFGKILSIRDTIGYVQLHNPKCW